MKIQQKANLYHQNFSACTSVARKLDQDFQVQTHRNLKCHLFLLELVQMEEQLKQSRQELEQNINLYDDGSKYDDMYGDWL